MVALYRAIWGRFHIIIRHLSSFMTTHYCTFIIFYGNTCDTCFRTAEHEDWIYIDVIWDAFQNRNIQNSFYFFSPSTSFLKVKVPFMPLVTTRKQNKTVLKGTLDEMHICKMVRCVILKRLVLLKSAQETQVKLADLQCRWTLSTRW